MDKSRLPVIACGMVGSRQGWVEAPYLPCPAGLSDLAADQGRPDAPLGTGAITLAQNFATEAEVDVAFADALAAGGVPLKSPEKVFWGGYSSYITDPDDNLWEIAYNPFMPLDDKGNVGS